MDTVLQLGTLIKTYLIPLVGAELLIEYFKPIYGLDSVLYVFGP